MCETDLKAHQMLSFKRPSESTSHWTMRKKKSLVLDRREREWASRVGDSSLKVSWNTDTMCPIPKDQEATQENHWPEGRRNQTRYPSVIKLDHWLGR